MITDLTTKEIYAQLRKELEKRLQSDSRLLAIAEKIKQKKADFKDTAEYSQIVARHISELIQQKIGTNSAFGIEFVCKELLKDHYSSINDVLGTVQAIVDEKNNIHIAPQKAPFPQERVNKVAHALMDPRVPIEVIKRRAGAPVENVANSFHDDYIKENAKFRNDAGLKCYINRTTDGNCCDWCTKMAGRYVYGEHPDDVFRRHDNCGCLTTYENGRQRQSVWSKKSWSREEEREYLKELDAKKKAKRLSPKQARELQAKNLRKYHGLTADSKGGIIKSLDIDDFKMMGEGHDIDPEALEVIASVVSEYEKSGLVHIDDFYFGSIANTETGTPLLQIDPIADRTLRLNVNTNWFSGKTLSEIDSTLKAYEKNLAVSLREAVIHEMGHAKAIKGMTIKDIRDFYDNIRGAEVAGISEYAFQDGAEALAEIEVLIARGSDIPEQAMEFYNKHMRKKK